ncbi:hypothetical protein Tco_0921133 [Tanacetum coccineum]
MLRSTNLNLNHIHTAPPFFCWIFFPSTPYNLSGLAAMPSISSLPPFMECGVGDRLVTLGTKGPETMCTRFIYEFPIFDKMKGVRELLEGLIPYSQRHYIVIDRFERSTLLLLDDPDVEAVYAPLPTSLHLQWGTTELSLEANDVQLLLSLDF